MLTSDKTTTLLTFDNQASNLILRYVHNNKKDMYAETKYGSS